jgi:sugar phosphate isomerase/epimerase
MLSAGDLTQLEWVDLCAGELSLDGVEFVLSHFPRLDSDYVAQLKKLCVDRCLTVAALHHDTPFDSSLVDEHVENLARSLDLAFWLGAPLIRFNVGQVDGSPAFAWRECIRGLKSACIVAKQRNIVLAVEPCAGSLVASPAEAKRALKECDSAWLRLAPAATLLATSQRDEWMQALDRTVFAVAPIVQLDTFGADETLDYIGVLELLWQERYQGFLSLEYRGGEEERPAMARAVAWVRGILAKDALRAAPTEV